MANTSNVDPVNVDSIFRTSGTPNNFSLSLFNPLNNIFNIKIVSTDFPATALFGINHSNNTLIIARNSLTRAYVHITPATYTDLTLAAAIQTALNDGTGVFGVTNWSVTFSGTAYTIANISPVNFYIASDGLINQTLGFNSPPQVVEGVSEIVEITCLVVASYAVGEYIDMNAENDRIKYRFWFDTTGTDALPPSASRILARVDISGSGSTNSVALALQGVINGTPSFSATVVASVVTVTNEVIGGVTLATYVFANNSFSIAQTQIGSASITSDSGTTLNSNNYLLVVSTAINPQQGVPTTIQSSRIVHSITTVNNTLVVNDGAADHIVTITPGQYNIYEIATVLTSEIATQITNSESLPITVEYILNSTTNNMEFIIRGASTLVLSGTFIKTFINYYISTDTINTNIEIYNPPLSATAVLIITPGSELYNISSIKVPPTTFKWRGAAKAANGKIYFAPFSADSVLIINTLDKSGDTTTIPINAAADGYNQTTGRWSDAIAAPNGLIYFVPLYDRYWAILDPATDTLNRDAVLAFGATSGNVVQAYSGGVLVGANIYCVPLQVGSGFHILNTNTNTLTFITSSFVTGTAPQYSAGIYHAGHNKVYFVPHWNDNILVVDVGNSNAVTALYTPLIPIRPNPLVLPYYELFSDIILAPNNKAYCIPFSEDFVMVLDFATDPPTISSPVGLTGLGTAESTYTVSEMAMTAGPVNGYTNVRKWSGGVLTPGGFIYCAPLFASRTLVIDTNTDTFSYSSTGLGTGQSKWVSGVVSDAYNVYQDSVRKSTAGHIVHKVYLNDPTNGRIVDYFPNSELLNFPQGYNIQNLDFQITDSFGNILTEMAGEWSMLMRVTHQ